MSTSMIYTILLASLFPWNCLGLGNILNSDKDGNIDQIVAKFLAGAEYSFLQEANAQQTEFGSKEAHFVRSMLKFADVADSKFNELLRLLETGAGGGIEKGITRGKTLEDFKNYLLNNAERLQKLTAEAKHAAVKEDDEVAEEWDTSCYRDYRKYVEPITDFLVRAIKDSLGDGQLDYILKLILDDAFPRKGDSFPEWGLPFLDAFGKIPAAITDGNLHWVGGYDMCEAQEVTHYYNITTPAEERSFTGRYCRVDIGPKPEEPSPENNETLSISLTIGLCVPNSCSREDVKEFLTNATLGRDTTRLLGLIFEFLGADVTDMFCGRGDIQLFDDPTARTASIILLTFVGLVIVGTIWDGGFRTASIQKEFEQYGLPVSPTTDLPETPPPKYDDTVNSTASMITDDQEDYWERAPGLLGRIDLFFVSFSIYTTFRKLFHTKGRDDHLAAVDGIKYLTMCYLVLGQSYLLGPVVSFVTVTANILRAITTLPKEWIFMPIISFHLTTDTFFVCSGILVTLFWFRRIEKNDQGLTVSLVIRNILHWYWRLMPSMMMVMMIFVVYYKFISTGPLVPELIPFAENCRPNWWTNLLMVQNLVNLDKQCMAWTWYFSAVFQLNLVAVLIFIIYHFSKYVAVAFFSALIAVHLGVSAYQSDGFLKKGILASFQDWNRYLYISPWGHAGSYFIGVLLALLLRKINFKAKLNIFVRIAGWLVGIGLILVVTFVPYDMYRDLDLNKWTLAGQVTYDTLSRTAWSLGIAWMIFASVTGNGGFIGDFLSWRGFRPLARMTYSMYIMHAVAILRYMYNRKTLLYVAANEMIYIFSANLLMTHVFGILVIVLFEYPFRGLEKMVVAKTKYDVMLAGTHPEKFDILETIDKYTAAAEPESKRDKPESVKLHVIRHIEP